MVKLWIDRVVLAPRRPFAWRAVWVLGLLQFLGNLASIPMLRATGVPAEPMPYWVLYTGLSFLVIAIAEFFAGRSGLRIPLLEGRLKRSELSDWSGRVLALSLLVAVVGSLPILLLNLDVNPEQVPAVWKMALASADAGIQEEIFYRFFLMSLFVGLGGILWKDRDGRPMQGVFWSAIIISGVIFGWAHIDDKISNPEIQASPEAFMTTMLVNTFFGMIFGWLYLEQGLESAILAHFMVDAIGISVVIPAYLSDNLLAQASVLLSLVLAGLGSWRLLMGRSSKGTNTGGHFL